MTCRQCQQSLSSYLDNVLSAHARQEIQGHLAHCSTCAERLRQFQENRQLVQHLPEQTVTDTMEMRLWQRLQDPRLNASADSVWAKSTKWMRSGTGWSRAAMARPKASRLSGQNEGSGNDRGGVDDSRTHEVSLRVDRSNLRILLTGYSGWSCGFLG